MITEDNVIEIFCVMDELSIYNVNGIVRKSIGQKYGESVLLHLRYEAGDFKYDMMVDQFDRLEVEPAFQLLNSDATSAVFR